MFNAGNLRAADVIALTDGYIGTMLYSELELLGRHLPRADAHLQPADGEGRVGGEARRHGHVNELLMLQAGARWKSRHKELVNLREGLYADIAAERDANQKVAAAEEKQQGGATVGRAIKGTLGGVADRGPDAAMTGWRAVEEGRERWIGAVCERE